MINEGKTVNLFKNIEAVKQVVVALRASPAMLPTFYPNVIKIGNPLILRDHFLITFSNNTPNSFSILLKYYLFFHF